MTRIRRMSAGVIMALASILVLSAFTFGGAGASHANPSQSSVPDWQQLGFPRVLALTMIPSDTATARVVSAGPYTFTIPAGAFTDPVRFEILSGSPEYFESGAPAGETPVLAFALRVIDMNTHQPIEKFGKPLTLTVTDPAITSGSLYYNISPTGTYTENSTGLTVSNGQLTHPIAGDPVGWVITSPSTP